MIHDNRITISIMLLILFSIAFPLIENPFKVASAQTESSITTDGLDTANQSQESEVESREGEQQTTNSQQQQQTFRSTFDTFVTSEPQGYGVYDERESNTFSPGETILLYMSPLVLNMEL